MGNLTRGGAVAATFLVAGAVAGPANAAAGSHGWDWGADGPQGAAAAGLIEVCNHSGYLFNVYADGPSARRSDLAGSFDECTHWAPVQPGHYDVGFGARTTTTAQNVIIQARFKRDGQTFYKVFNSEGVVGSNVGPGSHTRLDLFIPQG